MKLGSHVKGRTQIEGENRVLRRIFASMKDEVTRDWRKLHGEELHNFYSSPYILRMINSRRLRLEGHVACVRDEKCK
jgi:hypothetical protein